MAEVEYLYGLNVEVRGQVSESFWIYVLRI